MSWRKVNPSLHSRFYAARSCGGIPPVATCAQPGSTLLQKSMLAPHGQNPCALVRLFAASLCEASKLHSFEDRLRVSAPRIGEAMIARALDLRVDRASLMEEVQRDFGMLRWSAHMPDLTILEAAMLESMSVARLELAPLHGPKPRIR